MKLHKTLYLKLLFAYLSFGILSLLLVSGVIGRLVLNGLIHDQAENLYRESQLVASAYAHQIRQGEEARRNAFLQLQAIDTYLDAQIRVIDSQGRQILDSRDELSDSESESPVFPDFDPTSSGTYYMTGDFYGAFEDDMLSVFYPVTSAYRVAGYVIIHSPMAEIYQSRDRIMRICYIVMLMVLLLSLLILIAFTHAVYRPLRRITHAAEEYANGNMSYDPDFHGKDEMGYLSETLYFMAAQIARSEDDQRKFIANVSHDFRSPLTSIRGYLTAMIDGTIPPELHEKYLTIVLNETDRLTKLTNGLLELNSLNQKGMVLSWSDFDINAVIKQTCETFEVQCDRKKISIELILSGETLYVHADQGKIQQVIYNLLDNAIKFSHNNSMIRIETTEKNDKVFLSVKDSGIGIPKDAQSRIFDRFYKTDLSRGKDKKGTGLGLSIAREIILAHNQNINVISTEGVGSEFIFTISRSKDMED